MSKADDIALEFNRVARGHQTTDVLSAGLAIACFAAKATGLKPLDVQKLVVKIWSTLPDETKSVQ